jgi:uncharacterized membrane protein
MPVSRARDRLPVRLLEEEIMSELIVSGFDDAHTAFLARAALARLQKELGLSVYDLAMVTRGEDGRVAVQQVVDLDGSAGEGAILWETWADLLFTPGKSTGTAGAAALAKGGVVAIDPALASRVAEQFRSHASALLVLVRSRVGRDQVLGVLQGFHAEIARVPLTGEDKPALASRYAPAAGAG